MLGAGGPMVDPIPIEVTGERFEAMVLRSEVPVLVDFYGSMCAPCKALAPTIDALAREYSGRAVVAKMNAEAFPMTCVEYGVTGLPTVLIFNHGEVVKKRVGLRSKSDLSSAIDDAISTSESL
jgi:thioredoxin